MAFDNLFVFLPTLLFLVFIENKTNSKNPIKEEKDDNNIKPIGNFIPVKMFLIKDIFIT